MTNIVYFIINLKKQQSILCGFNFRDGLGTCHWGSGTTVEESCNGLFNPCPTFPLVKW